MKILQATSIIFLVIASATGYAQQDSIPPLITDRPDATESSVLIPKNYFQLEAGSQISNGNLQKDITFGTALLRVGVLDNLEVRLGLDYSGSRFKNDFSEDTNSFSPILLGVKVGIAKEQGLRPEMAILSHLSLPYLSNELTTSGIDFRLAFSHTLSERSGLSYNLGALWDGANNGLQYIYTISYGYSITSNLGWYGEIYGDIPENTMATHYIDSGFTYKLATNFQLDAYIGKALNNDPSLIVGGGFSYRLPK